MSLGGRSAKQFASQGQARSIVLALLLAIVEVIEERLGVVPAAREVGHGVRVDTRDLLLDAAARSNRHDPEQAERDQLSWPARVPRHLGLPIGDCACFYAIFACVAPVR